ncbi:hypothetical protein DFS34DRAFT_596647 [Phlyctochytrium arcticum]|nr:hypothetical protein DFS34DRAFT_596647 [Phlyctochytrium arcticum]
MPTGDHDVVANNHSCSHSDTENDHEGNTVCSACGQVLSLSTPLVSSRFEEGTTSLTGVRVGQTEGRAGRYSALLENRSAARNRAQQQNVAQIVHQLRLSTYRERIENLYFQVKSTGRFLNGSSARAIVGACIAIVVRDLRLPVQLCTIAVFSDAARTSPKLVKRWMLKVAALTNAPLRPLPPSSSDFLGVACHALAPSNGELAAAYEADANSILSYCQTMHYEDGKKPVNTAAAAAILAFELWDRQKAAPVMIESVANASGVTSIAIARRRQELLDLLITNAKAYPIFINVTHKNVLEHLREIVDIVTKRNAPSANAASATPTTG